MLAHCLTSFLKKEKEKKKKQLFIYHFVGDVFATKGRKCENGRKYENGPNLPLGSLEVFKMENQAQNSQCIENKG